MSSPTSVQALKSAFLALTEQNRNRFAVPVQVDQILPDRITFSFAEYPPEIRAWCGHRSNRNDSELLVDAKWGDIWDGLCWRDSA